MTQSEINAMEWNNPANWSSPRRVGIYSSKKDTRTWVPKPFPVLGWTVNLARPMDVVWAFVMFAAVVGLAFAVGTMSAK